MTFEELYLEYFRPLLRQALHQRVPYHDAEDVVHDVFMSYLRFEETVAEAEKYLKVAVRYRCASYWRREARRRGAVLPEGSSAPEYDRRIAVAAIWPRLSSRDRRVLGLRFQGELKIKQIATRLGVSPGRAEKILRGAIDRAAALIDETERRGVGGVPPRTDTYPAYRRALRSRRRFEVLANDPRMTRRDSQQCDRRTVRMPAALLPVAQRVDADPHRLGKLRLRQPDESPKRGNISTRLELSEHEPLSQPCGHGSGQLLFRQLGDLGHFISST